MGCEWPEAKLRQQVPLALSALLFLASGWRALRENTPSWIPLWLAGLAGWVTIPKYFICARCENYGRSCDFFYGGRYASLLFRKQDRPFNAAGYVAEGATLAVFQLLPAIAARKDRKMLVLYGLAGVLFQAILVAVCCIKCVDNAKDPWKRAYCPTYRLVEALGLAEPTDEARNPIA